MKNLLIPALAALLLPLSAHALTETVNGITWTYTVSNGKATIGDGSAAAIATTMAVPIIIPEKLGGWDVTSIGERAFASCTELTSITIPDSVTSIGDSAFFGCYGLTSVTIPAGVTNIGNSAFWHCSKLTSVTIPDSVTSIGDSAFFCCSGLTSITIPAGVTNIGTQAFSSCSGLTSITIPDGVTSIGESAFYGCSGLTSITIPESVTSIGERAFYDCSGLMSITIPDGVTSIEWCAFSGCSGLTSITIPDSVTIIESSAFSGCSGLTSIAIPDSVTSIGVLAFYGCSGLTSITIPDSVTSIESSAFSGCSGLTSITIPDSVTSIETDAFKMCSGLTSITIPDGVTSVGASAFSGCSGLTSITIPDSVTSIGRFAFEGCSRLTSITIPDSVTSIGQGAFQLCSGLRLISIPDSLEDEVESWWLPASCQVIIRKRLYSIVFDGAGGCTPSPIKATAGTELMAPLPPTRDGYTFAGWSPAFPSTMPEGGATLVAQWTPRNYMIAFDSAGGSAVASITAAYGTSLTAPAAPTRDGYTFAGWSPAFPAKMPLGGATLVAQWTPRNYSITFDSAGGSAVAPITASYGADLTEPAAPTRAGYTFAGWSPAFPTTMPAGGATLAAQWTPIRYTVKFMGNGGVYTEDEDWVVYRYTQLTQKFAYGTKQALDTNVFERAGYAFVGWSKTADGAADYEDGETVLNLADQDGTVVTLHAVWAEAFTITFDSAGGSAVAPITAPFGAALAKPAPPKRDGYAFAGWSPAFPETMPEGGATLVALWNPDTTFFVWTVSAGEATVTGVNGTPEGSLEIPGELGGCPVVAIGGRAFSGFSGLTTVSVPDGVTGVGADAFAGCAGLKAVFIPEALEGLTGTWGLPPGCRIFIHPDYVEVENNRIPKAWIFEHAPAAFSGAGENWASAARATAANGKNKVWECYVAGLDPQCATDIFEARIGFGPDGFPVVSWTPDLGDGREYAIQGKTSLDSPWGAVDDDSRFFRVRVALPGGFGDQTIPFDSAGGSAVAPITAAYGAALSEPAAPTRSGYMFKGWAPEFPTTMPFGGMMLVATWELDLASYFSWSDSGGTITITGVNTTPKGKLVVPSEINGIPVTGIGDRAFANCRELTSVIIPDGVTNIGEGAFLGCTGLTAISIPDSLILIGRSAFALCSGLTSITIPKSVKEIGETAFGSCSGLSSVTISDGVTTIGTGAFEECRGLSFVSIPNSVTNIGARAFYNCTGLSSISIPEGVLSLENHSFSGCTSLKSVSLPESLASIGVGAFEYCYRLTELTIPDNVIVIGWQAFQGCSDLTSISIGGSVTSIGWYAFVDCSALTSLTIPDSVTNIGDRAFLRCSNLTSLSLPSHFKGNTSNMWIPGGCAVTFRD